MQRVGKNGIMMNPDHKGGGSHEGGSIQSGKSHSRTIGHQMASLPDLKMNASIKRGLFNQHETPEALE
jgi:hypothetical protein